MTPADREAVITLLRAGPEKGRSKATLGRGVQRGRLKRLRPGIFVSASEWEAVRLSDRHRAFSAAVALRRPSTVLCRVTALSIYGVPLMNWPREVHLRSVPRNGRGRQPTPFFPIYGQPPLKPSGVNRALADLQLLSGELKIPAMSLEVPGVRLEGGGAVSVLVEPLPYVLVDTLPKMPRQEAIMVLDAAMAGNYDYGVRVGQEALDQVEEFLVPGRTEVWQRLRQFGDSRSESPGESRCRVLFDELGFEPPELQKVIHLPRIGRVRVDFWWDGVICEFDGMVKYTRGLTGQPPEETVQQEKLREDALRMLNYQVVRLTWNDLNDPEVLGQKLIRAGVPHRAFRRFTVVA